MGMEEMSVQSFPNMLLARQQDPREEMAGECNQVDEVMGGFQTKDCCVLSRAFFKL